MSMPFDRRTVEPCHYNENCIDPLLPDNTSDERCLDPVFAANNPAICGELGTQTRLIIKPEALTKCTDEQVEFDTYLISNGAEQLITTGLTYVSSNQSIVLISAATGSGTVVGTGLASVTVTWQNLTASAQVTGLGAGTLSDTCCDGQNVGMVLTIDNSRSMGQAFSGTYGTRFLLAKELANNLAAELDTTKDSMAVQSFNESANPELAFSQSVSAIQTAIGAIGVSDASTNLYDALELAINTAQANATLERKVIILFSDGINKLGPNPYNLAYNFKTAGGIIIVVGLRASGAGFTLLNNLASGGFFLNATEENEDDIPNFLSGLKGYFCAGNCVPPGDEIVNKGKLNYEGFLNWDSVAATAPVDLIGGTYPHQFYDFLPGNGLYVDLHGSSAPWLGKITSKTTFALQAGQQYEVKIRLAGNQRNATSRTTRLRLGPIDATEVVPWKQNFADYTWTTTPGVLTNAKLIIEDTAPTPTSFGNLLDYVRLRNLTTGITLLEDNFDNENVTYIPPSCGSATVPYEYSFVNEGLTIYGYAGCLGYGCLAEPIPPQEPDPDPLPDIE